jgi:hypothetical protein
MFFIKPAHSSPNHALQQTAGAGSLIEGQCSSGPRRC